MAYTQLGNTSELDKLIAGCTARDADGSVTVTDEKAFRGDVIDTLVYNAVFAKDAAVKSAARKTIRSAARSLGAFPASIQGVYEAMGRKEIGGFTVPAVNIRGMTYVVMRALIRAAIKNNNGAFIFEIAKSEIGYTFQNPDEYTVVCLAAAIKEGYRGPLFIQGDHFQVAAKKFKENPEKEKESLRALIKEAIEAGFYNIDIDSSTLVELDKPSVIEEQRLNFEVAAELTKFIREIEPKGVAVSVGGEIGEVGKANSNPEELQAFMDGYNDTLAKLGNGLKGISKISVQTGTSHGGIPLPDGSVAKVKLDFATLETLSHISRDKYGLCGAVQHGASTLPDELFDKFPATTTGEIHLATGFQNMQYDLIPAQFRDVIYATLRAKCADEAKQGETDEQFIYKTRKKGFGFHKEEFWTLPEEVQGKIGKALEDKFDFFMKKLKSVNTADAVRKYVPQR